MSNITKPIGGSTDLVAIEAHVRQHLTILTKRWPELDEPVQFEIRCLERDTKFPTWEFFKLNEIDQAVEYVANQNTRNNVYVTINPIRIERQGKASSTADVVAAFFVFVDADDTAGIEGIQSFVGPRPMFTVKTGNTPHPRGHAYWELDEPCLNLDAWTDLQKSMIRSLSTDPSIHNPDRIMRVAGTVSWPHEGKIDRGYVPELTSIKTEFKHEITSYAFETMFKAFDATAAPLKCLDIDLGPQSLDRDAASMAAMNGDHWDNRIWALVNSYVRKGNTDREIHILTAETTQPGYTLAQTRAEVQSKIDRARENSLVGDDTIKGILPKATPVRLETLQSLPPRRWQYGTKLIRGFISVMAAPPGTGKSAWTTTVALDLASGQKTLHDRPIGRQKVWLINLEDPLEETLRKVWACIKHPAKMYNENTMDNLFVDSGRDQSFVVVEETSPNFFTITPSFDALRDEIVARQIDVLILDPAVKLHTVNENAAKSVDFVMGLFAKLADECDISILLVHHTRKGFVAGDADSIRGSSAMSGAARVAVTLSTMTVEEAEKFDVPLQERRQLIRLDNAKANLDKPSDKAEWIKLDSVELGNGNSQYPNGDSVQAAIPWQPPDAWDGITTDKANEILRAIDKGTIDESGETERYSAHFQSKERWAGNVIIRLTKTDGIEKSTSQAKEILKKWIKEELLAEEEYRSPKQRKSRKGLVMISTVGKILE